jgi:uncharacterized protein involved in exopolysaccharide biosynthesis
LSCVLTGVLSVFVLPRGYQADATLVFTPNDTIAGSLGLSSNGLGGSVSHAADLAVSLAQTRRLRALAATRVSLRQRVPGMGDPADELAYLKSRVSLRTGGSGQVNITCTATGTPRGLGSSVGADRAARDLARDILQAYVELLSEDLSRITQAERAATREALERQLEEAMVAREGDGQPNAYLRQPWGQQALTELAVRAELAGAAERRRDPEFHVIDPPESPLRPSSPHPLRDVVLAAIAVTMAFALAATIGAARQEP